MAVGSSSTFPDDIDPVILEATVQYHLQDSDELLKHDKGKQPADTLTDAQLALQLYTDELKRLQAMLSDCKMAQSIAVAVMRDGNSVDEMRRAEQQASRDREIAREMDGRSDEGDEVLDEKADHDSDVWHEAEMLEKAAAIYMIGPEQRQPRHMLEGPIEDDEDDGIIAESSTWAADRTTTKSPIKGHCVACDETMDFFDVARVPCEHEYCRGCLAHLFTLSMTDESLFPPRCCRQEIPLDRVRFFMPSELAKEFDAKYDELGTKNRTYCHDATCSTFIPRDSISDDIATCPRCTKTTCVICKAPSHSGDCPEDEALHQLVETATALQWQRCYACYRLIQLDTGCNHIR